MSSADSGAARSWTPALAIGAAAVLLLGTYLSSQPFWIDADKLALALEEGRRVAHPPGYAGFLRAARLLHDAGLPAYRSLQVLSALSYLASIPVLLLALRRCTTPRCADFLTLAYACSWVALNIATVGTSHASDLLFSAILVRLAVLPRPDRGSRWWHPVLFLTIAWAASFRMSSAVMAGPFLLAVLVRDRRLPIFWFSAAGGALLVAGVVAHTASCFGGWQAYRSASAALHEINAPSGLLSGGEWPKIGVNLFRAAWWLFLAAPLLPWLVLVRRHRATGIRWSGWPMLLPAALAGGVLVINFGYLCVHPGYLAPAIPPLFILFARVLEPGGTIVRTAAVQAVLSLGLFFALKPVQTPSSVPAAVANTLLLQYSAATQRAAHPILSLSGWLHLSGRDALVPEERRERAGNEAATHGNP